MKAFVFEFVLHVIGLNLSNFTFGKTERCMFSHENKQFPNKSKHKLKWNTFSTVQCSKVDYDGFLRMNFICKHKYKTTASYSCKFQPNVYVCLA